MRESRPGAFRLCRGARPAGAARNIVLYTQLLQQRYAGILDDKGREACQISADGAKRMQSLLDGLLAYTRVVSESEVEGDMAARSALDCTQILASFKENLRTAIEEARAEILCHELPLVNARDTHLLQLFQNLLSNAIKYKKPGENYRSFISPRARKRGCWVFLVQDNGVGIGPEYSEKNIRGFQTSARKGNTRCGHGASICSRIVAHYGGKIWVESEEGRGSTFAFTLPRTTTEGNDIGRNTRPHTDHR